MEAICEKVVNNSLVEIYSEQCALLTRGRATIDDNRVLVKVFEKEFPLEFGDVFFINHCFYSEKVQFLGFQEGVIEAFRLEEKPKMPVARLCKTIEGIIKIESNFQRDSWGSYIIDEPYYYATIVHFNAKGATFVSSLERNLSDCIYLFFEWQLFEYITECKIKKISAVDEYKRDFIYEVDFINTNGDMEKAVSLYK